MEMLVHGLEDCGARKGFPLGTPGPDPSQCLHLLSPFSCLGDDGSSLLNTLWLSGRRQCVLCTGGCVGLFCLQCT